jgi:RNA polymerase sigma-70 factor (ECF subfamily)
MSRDDASAFAALVGRHGGAVLRLARALAPDRAAADALFRETWLAALERLPALGDVPSARTLLFRILCDRARGAAGGRDGGFPAPEPEDGPGAAAVDPGCFDASGAWAEPPRAWSRTPPDVDRIAEAVERLPAGERAVLLLRDVEGLGDAEVCDLLDLAEPRERALLNRARATLCRALAACPGGAREVVEPAATAPGHT